MNQDELIFIEEQLAATELLPCATCGQQTLHAHQQVLDVSAVATVLLMQCTCCQTTREWVEWKTTDGTRQN